ncbi:MAG TPA: hypothetical protein VOB72_08945 [Candidatus Dormibacteraeota bacterium]|nr:hypothetical protein [Candidatus Dormibacteraeota bacterium]
MAALSSAATGRRPWHPVTVAATLPAAALAAALAAASAAGPAWLGLGAWLLMGTASGYAVSGST